MLTSLKPYVRVALSLRSAKVEPEQSGAARLTPSAHAGQSLQSQPVTVLMRTSRKAWSLTVHAGMVTP